MIDQLLIIFFTISIYEFIRYIKLLVIFNSNTKIFKNILNLFKDKKTSDEIKQKLIFNYSKSLLLSSFKIMFILSIIVIYIFLLDRLSSSFLNFMITFNGLLEITLFFLIYHQLRKYLNAKL